MTDKRILSILVLAFALRFAGLGYGLPDIFHQDEPIIVNHAMAIGAAGWNTHFFIIPPFTMYLLFGLSAVYYLVCLKLGIFQSPVDFAMKFLVDPSQVYWIGRTVLGVLFGVMTVLWVWRCARRYFGDKVAFRSAILLAILPIHVQHSHYIYADIPVTFGVTAAFFCLLGLAQRGTLKAYLIYGAILGWAASVKYTALYFAPALLGAVSMQPSAFFSRAHWSRLVLSGLACIGVFMVCFPFSWLDATGFLSQISHQSGAEGFVSPAHHMIYSIVGGSGVVFVIMAIVGLWATKRSNPDLARVCGFFLGSYFLVSIFFSQPYARYMIPIMPVLAVMAGVGLEKLETRWGRCLKITVLTWLMVLELLVPSLYGDYLFTQKDTRTQCKEWFEKNVQADTTVVLDHRFFGPHLRPNEAQIRDKYSSLGGEGKDAVKKKRLDLLVRASEGMKGYRTLLLVEDLDKAKNEFLFSGPFVTSSPEELSRSGADYLVVHYFDKNDARRSSVSQLTQSYERVQSFSPYRDVSRRFSWDPQSSTGAPHLACELLGRTTLGPYIEVYRVHDR